MGTHWCFPESQTRATVGHRSIRKRAGRTDATAIRMAKVDTTIASCWNQMPDQKEPTAVLTIGSHTMEYCFPTVAADAAVVAEIVVAADQMTVAAGVEAAEAEFAAASCRFPTVAVDDETVAAFVVAPGLRMPVQMNYFQRVVADEAAAAAEPSPADYQKLAQMKYSAERAAIADAIAAVHQSWLRMSCLPKADADAMTQDAVVAHAAASD